VCAPGVAAMLAVDRACAYARRTHFAWSGFRTSAATEPCTARGCIMVA
jgi:hypothetical protein